jgi:hypothetical protein
MLEERLDLARCHSGPGSAARRLVRAGWTAGRAKSTELPQLEPPNTAGRGATIGGYFLNDTRSVRPHTLPNRPNERGELHRDAFWSVFRAAMRPPYTLATRGDHAPSSQEAAAALLEVPVGDRPIRCLVRVKRPAVRIDEVEPRVARQQM